ncbi:hypothetical protein EV179_002377 [Coemansia sp. RSA 487]|nr:hypothetical protein EV179_002377 [Coemansia sp. RSA 487]
MYADRASSTTNSASFGNYIDRQVFDDATLEQNSNPWAPVSAGAADMPRARALRRVVQRRRAKNDPLLTPSATDVSLFARNMAHRAESGLLESIDDAISSPLPRSETHMVSVKSDSDIGTPGAPSMRYRAATSPTIPANGQLTTEFSCGLAISATDKHRSIPISSSHPLLQRMPNILIPTQLGEGAIAMSRSCVEDSISGTDTTSPTLNAAQPSVDMPRMRSIKMIRHSVQAPDSLESLSVHYGISVSHLKRLNRLWHASEIATRDYLYIPLRMCHPRYTVAYIEFVNSRYNDETINGAKSTVQPIDLVEVVLGYRTVEPGHDSASEGHTGSHASHKHPQLDFLAVRCKYCQKQFCAEHGSIVTHRCPCVPEGGDTSVSTAGNIPITNYTRPDRGSIEHVYKDTKRELSVEQVQALEHFRNSDQSERTAAKRLKQPPRKSPKIELMRLKAKATGNSSIDMNDRKSVVGNAAAQLAKQMRLSMLPNIVYRLHRPGASEALPSNKSFDSLLVTDSGPDEGIYNGCTLELKS